MIHRTLRYCGHALRNQWLGTPRLKEMQEKRLRAIIRHAYQTVEFYYKEFKAAKVRPEDIKSQDDLPKLPILSSDTIIRNFPDKIVAKGFSLEDCLQRTTTGTTKEAMRFVWDKRFRDYSQGLKLRRTLASGVKLWWKAAEILYAGPRSLARELHASRSLPGFIPFHGRFINGPYLVKRLYLTYGIDDVLSDLVRLGPKVIYSRPSYLRLLAEAVEGGIDLVSPEVIITSGEILDGTTREFLHSVFESNISDLYGSLEFGSMAWECMEHSGYHIDIDNVVMEFVKDGIPAPGERGEILVTGLLNYAMPLIRYRIGDVGISSDEMCPCGRGLPLMKAIEGRAGDFLAFPHGRLISPRDIMSELYSVEGISRWQVIQKGEGVLIRFAKGRRFSDRSAEQLEAECRELFGDNFEIEAVEKWDMPVKFQPIVPSSSSTRGMSV